jgi:HIRAN domain
MGLWRWLFGPKERGVVAGDDEFQFHVVGSSYHQTTLEDICGGRTREGVHRYCAALLSPQPDNRYDRHAIAVMIHGQEVGFLDREDARDFGRILHQAGFADAACEALIVGGWYRGGHDWGYFGVRLNACLPFNVYTAREWSHRAS